MAAPGGVVNGDLCPIHTHTGTFHKHKPARCRHNGVGKGACGAYHRNALGKLPCVAMSLYDRYSHTLPADFAQLVVSGHVRTEPAIRQSRPRIRLMGTGRIWLSASTFMLADYVITHRFRTDGLRIYDVFPYVRGIHHLSLFQGL